MQNKQITYVLFNDNNDEMKLCLQDKKLSMELKFNKEFSEESLEEFIKVLNYKIIWKTNSTKTSEISPEKPKPHLTIVRKK